VNNSIGIVAVVKNEEKYLEEWVRFEIAQGVSQFYFTENGSTDSTVELIKHLTSEGFPIIWNRDDQNPIQFKAYNYWLNHGKQNPETSPTWLAFLDCDEFLYSPGGAKLPDILQNYSNASAVASHWVFWGSNGETEYRDDLVVRRFTKRSRKADKHTKAIVRVKDGIRVGRNPHYFEVTGKTVDENGNILKNWHGLKENGTADILRINHYHTKSRAEYFERKKLPDPGTGKVKTNIEEMFQCHDINEVEDLTAHVFGQQIKLAV